MKRTISFTVIAALFAVCAAFTNKQVITGYWNVDHPFSGSPGIYYATDGQVKAAWCPGLNNVECAYLISNPGVIIKKPY
jgi:hypothetical protein